MSLHFDGKVAIVTGGARGIGAAVMSRLAEAGAKVIIADIIPEGEEVAAGMRARGREVTFSRTDVTSADGIKAMVALAQETFGGLDVLVNNAGIYPRADLLETTEELWDRIMAINLKSVYLACQAAVPAMIRRGGGAIVNVGSLHAAGGSPNLFAYAVSKGGVLTLTRNLARALAPQRIRVNCVHPGWVATEGERTIRREEGFSDTWPQEKGQALPFGRLQTPEEVAAAIVFLASEEASQVTGQELAVAGGLGIG